MDNYQNHDNDNNRVCNSDKNNNDNEEIEYYGSLGDNDSNVNNPNAREQIEKLQKTYSKQVPEETQDHTPLPWPFVSKEPENEFTGIRIFVNMFPWLFPGGIGDINETQRSEKNYISKHGLTIYFIILMVDLLKTKYGVSILKICDSVEKICLVVVSSSTTLLKVIFLNL